MENDPRYTKDNIPVTLKFGEHTTFSHNCDELLEATVKTNRGDWMFNFNN